jgi:type III pantothenate kinase
MILLLDVGNTRLKWALSGARGWIAQGVLSNQEIGTLALKQWQNIPRPLRVVGVNVAGEAVRVRVEGQLARWRLWPQWLKPAAAGSGITNAYDEAAQLGPDRWAALVAARKLVPGDCVVVNAGTALTVDALDAQNVFRGGFILPGLAMMRQALAANTARLQVTGGLYRDFPTNTADAIMSGSIQAACGAILRLRALLATGPEPVTVVVSGGAAGEILPRLEGPVIHREHLVLEGVEAIAEEGRT